MKILNRQLRCRKSTNISYEYSRSIAHRMPNMLIDTDRMWIDVCVRARSAYTSLTINIAQLNIMVLQLRYENALIGSKMTHDVMTTFQGICAQLKRYWYACVRWRVYIIEWDVLLLVAQFCTSAFYCIVLTNVDRIGIVTNSFLFPSECVYRMNQANKWKADLVCAVIHSMTIIWFNHF